MTEIKIPEEVGATRNRPLQILAVDDNAINLRLMTAALKRFGCVVDLAENGEVSVVKFREKLYDAILMDIMMPVMDGMEATREIRKIESERQIPKEQRVKIIAITANALDDDRQQFFEAGMDHCLSKPLDISELKVILHL